MREVISIFRHEAVKKFFQIASRGWVGVLHDDNTATRVLNENSHSSVSDAAFVDLRLNLIGDFVEALAVGAHFELVVVNGICKQLGFCHVERSRDVSVKMGSAAALAKFYSRLAIGGKFNGKTFFSQETLAQMATTLSDGVDRVFQIPTAFSAGFMKDSRDAALRMFGPSATFFGHPGAGGSHVFADPENRIAFAHVMNQWNNPFCLTKNHCAWLMRFIANTIDPFFTACMAVTTMRLTRTYRL
jgi:hypothetical protein